MIRQITTVKAQSTPKTKATKKVALGEREAMLNGGSLPDHVELWSPLTAGPYMVPVIRWIE